MAGYSSNVSSLHGPGFALLGNAAEFLDPVFSSGVTIALNSADLAIPNIVKELKGEAVDWQSAFADPLKKGVDVFRVFVEAWYEGTLQDIVLRPPDGDHEVHRMVVYILSGYCTLVPFAVAPDGEREVLAGRVQHTRKKNKRKARHVLKKKNVQP